MSVRLGVGSDGAQQPLPGRTNAPQRKLSDRLWDILQPLARLWGIITAIVLSGAGAELTVLKHEGAPWLLVGAALVLMLETMWVAALFIDLLARRGEYTLPLRCWDFARWSCGRARAPLYACAATALLLVRPSALAAAAGACLLTLASLRAAVPFAPYATHGVHAPRAGTALLSQVDVPDAVFYRGEVDEKSEEMKVLKPAKPQRSRSLTPAPPILLDL